MRKLYKGPKPQNSCNRGTTGADGWTPEPGELVHVWVKATPKYATPKYSYFSQVYTYLGVRDPGLINGAVYKAELARGRVGWNMAIIEGTYPTWNWADSTYRMSEEEQAAYRLTGEVPRRE